jgi:hypothetical protein
MSKQYQLRQSLNEVAEMFEPQGSSTVAGVYPLETLGCSG